MEDTGYFQLRTGDSAGPDSAGLLLASARPAVKPCAFLLVRGWGMRGPWRAAPWTALP